MFYCRERISKNGNITKIKILLYFIKRMNSLFHPCSHKIFHPCVQHLHEHKEKMKMVSHGGNISTSGLILGTSNPSLKPKGDTGKQLSAGFANEIHHPILSIKPLKRGSRGVKKNRNIKLVI
jgi:hypothetical protein